MFELKHIEQLANELGVDILAKVVFSFSPDIIMSPLALPRKILNSWIDEYLDGRPDSIRLANRPLRDMLIQLKTRPTFQEQWPDTYQKALAQGKRRMLQLETIRHGELTLADILSMRTDINDWYQSI
jgi:hypothetical protein